MVQVSAQDNLSEPQLGKYKSDPMSTDVFYHASDKRFGRGRMLTPGHEPLNSPEPQEHVYFGKTPEDVEGWGKRVYAVQPQGDYEDDPHTPGAFRSTSPVRVRWQHSSS